MDKKDLGTDTTTAISIFFNPGSCDKWISFWNKKADRIKSICTYDGGRDADLVVSDMRLKYGL